MPFLLAAAALCLSWLLARTFYIALQTADTANHYCFTDTAFISCTITHSLPIACLTPPPPPPPIHCAHTTTPRLVLLNCLGQDPHTPARTSPTPLLHGTPTHTSHPYHYAPLHTPRTTHCIATCHLLPPLLPPLPLHFHTAHLAHIHRDCWGHLLHTHLTHPWTHRHGQVWVGHQAPTTGTASLTPGQTHPYLPHVRCPRHAPSLHRCSPRTFTAISPSPHTPTYYRFGISDLGCLPPHTCTPHTALPAAHNTHYTAFPTTAPAAPHISYHYYFTAAPVLAHATHTPATPRSRTHRDTYLQRSRTTIVEQGHTTTHS